MSPEKTKQLLDKYPIIFSKIKYLECDDGWFSIIDNLCKTIESYIKDLTKEKQLKYHAVQIKQKFGGLRYYLNYEDDYVSDQIRLSEILSNNTCENCGSPGIHRNIRGWIVTLCDVHYQKKMR